MGETYFSYVNLTQHLPPPLSPQFEEEYASDNDDDRDLDEGEGSHSDTSAPDLVTTREDFQAVLDDFLAQEMVGKKLQQTIGITPSEKLGALRRALVNEEDEKVAQSRREALLNRECEDDMPVPVPFDIDQQKDRWDCETILSMYIYRSHSKLTCSACSHILQS